MIMPVKGVRQIYKIINEEDTETVDTTWLIQVQLAQSDVDDSFDSESGLQEFQVAAETFEDAVKYASQYLLMKARDDTSWVDTVIVSINKQQ